MGILLTAVAIMIIGALAAGIVAGRELLTVHKLTQPVDSPLGGLWLGLLNHGTVGASHEARPHVVRYRRSLFISAALVVLAAIALFFAPAIGQG
jgi:hypothetical protein